MHPFFVGIDWKKIKDKKAPFLPELQTDIDTKYFDNFEEEESWLTEESQRSKKSRKEVYFIGYTYKKD